MSSFLSAAENVARQRHSVRRALKMMEEESRAVEPWLFYFWFVLHRKNVSARVR